MAMVAGCMIIMRLMVVSIMAATSETPHLAFMDGKVVCASVENVARKY